MKEPQNPPLKISNNKASDTTIKILGDEGRRGGIKRSQRKCCLKTLACKLISITTSNILCNNNKWKTAVAGKSEQTEMLQKTKDSYLQPEEVTKIISVEDKYDGCRNNFCSRASLFP